MTQATPATTQRRVLSLDFFRGLTVASMILVNNPGDWGHIYPPLEHSKWNGCTPTDLVFPFFLFIVGVSINFAIGDKRSDPSRHGKILWAAGRRAAILFGLGLLLSLIPSFDFVHLRIMGVLQRIGIVFFICVFLFIKTSTRTQICLFFSLLVLYWLLMTLVPVPGIGAANLQPGTNLAAWLDSLLLTPNHMWRETKTWDPEGILSTLPSISTCILGLLVGGILRRKELVEGDGTRKRYELTEGDKVAWLFSIALLAVIAGLIWDGFFPMNKALWTSSFVLFTGGLATAGLALSYWLIDVQHYRRFITPFVAFGANAITVYVGSGWIPLALSYIKIPTPSGSQPLTQYLYEVLFASFLSPINASLACALAYVIILSIPLWWMYKKKVYIKI